MRDIKSQTCLTKHASRKSEARQSFRKFCRKHSGELLQKRICWTKRKQEREIRNSALYGPKNCGLRANDHMAKMGCRQEKI